MSRVLLVSGSLPPIRCGVGYYTARLSRELARQKIDFEVLSTKGVDEDVPAKLRTVPNWRIWSLPKMLAALKASGAEIIHIQYPAVGYRRQLGINLLPYALRLFKPRLKLLVTLHEYHGSRWLGRWRDFITVLPAHKIIVSNQADQMALPSRLARKSELIPIGSNLEKVAKNPKAYEAVLRKHKLDPKKSTILFFGFAYPAKGLETLLAAMDEPYLQDWQLLLLGDLKTDNNYHKMLLSRIESLNESRARAAVAGFLPDKAVSAILQEGRYFVLPQPAPVNPKSSTAITAVQHNMIMVSCGADQPDLTAPFRHLVNCYLLTDMSAVAISDAIRQLENSPSDRQKIVDGTENLEEYFSWPSIVKKHLRLYEEL